MSKSLGNVIDAAARSPTSSAPRSCACGCAATDYSGDLAIDDKILARVVDAYRRIRNTLRFLLANTSDFDVDEGRGAARASCSRSTATRWRCAAQLQAEVARALRASTSSTRWSPSCRSFCSRRPGRVLPRRAEGPALHHGAGVARAALGADRAVAHHARDAALDGAVLSASRPRRRGRCSRRRPMRTRSSPRPTCDCRPAGRDDALLAKWTRIREIRDDVQQGDRGAARAPARSARRCRPRSICSARRAARAAGDARRRPAVRDHHLSRASLHAAPDAQNERIDVTPSAADQVRALLALARRRRPRPSAPDDLRPLHRQPVRRRRNAHGGLMAAQVRVASRLRDMVPWLGIAAGRDRARPVHQDRGRARVQLGDSMPITSFFNLILTYNRGAAFSFLAAASGWQGTLVLR